ncbi:uncharacterized protein LOC111411166 [Olea europaea var. sylvestris]|uniref:uncharacterized protein LOC111411166 n=1 Tax=Olea europaea var. sylvestris TaxID=158386 RepID=UPI000C1D400C|nr:uncharacterized protein LOC111411166 [Olea europaea var. sylvestris]
MESLQEMFGHQSRQARQASIRAIMNTRMKSGASVRDHMLTMIGHFNAAEVLGADIDSETQIEMVLETLPEIAPKCLSVLKARSGSALIVTVGPSHPKSSGGKGGKKRKRPNKKPNSKSKGKKTTVDGKPKGKGSRKPSISVKESTLLGLA